MSKLTKALTAAAGNAGGESLYVEDVFSTYLYDGVSSAITITNGIDLADSGGLVWTKRRATDARSHILFDSERGASSRLMTDQTAAAANQSYSITMNSDGYSWSGADNDVTIAGSTYASWTFRKAEKFFDVVTYTGDGVAGRTVAHNLGSVPGMVIVKSTNANVNWEVYHKSLGNTHEIRLNQTTAALDDVTKWNDTTPTDSVFTVGTDNTVNRDGWTYVAYLFASDAGGFGDDGSESIIKCGSYTGNGSTNGPEIDLGFEPQWLMVKNSTASSDWYLVDTMRGFTANTSDSYQRLMANLSNAEDGSNAFSINSTGFKLVNATYNPNVSGNSYIYIAIRRPMKTPESGTEVYQAGTRQSTSPGFVSDFPVDMFMRRYLSGAGYPDIGSRLQGAKAMQTSETFAEGPDSSSTFDYMNGYYTSSSSDTNHFSWMFKRATGFFDVVAYSGNSTNPTSINHNLGVIPELMIFKRRNDYRNWLVYHDDLALNEAIVLNLTNAKYTDSSTFPSKSHTATQFIVGNNYNVNGSGSNYIAYLFATLAGVSKVGSYTGTGSNVDVDCGFSAGARFILIKRTDSTGDWYVWDSVRGIVAGNDPYLLLNSTAAEVTSTDYIDPLSSGFTVTSSAPAALNASGGSYIFLAIA